MAFDKFITRYSHTGEIKTFFCFGDNGQAGDFSPGKNQATIEEVKKHFIDGMKSFEFDPNWICSNLEDLEVVMRVFHDIFDTHQEGDTYSFQDEQDWHIEKK